MSGWLVRKPTHGRDPLKLSGVFAPRLISMGVFPSEEVPHTHLHLHTCSPLYCMLRMSPKQAFTTTSKHLLFVCISLAFFFHYLYYFCFPGGGGVYRLLFEESKHFLYFGIWNVSSLPGLGRTSILIYRSGCTSPALGVYVYTFEL